MHDVFQARRHWFIRVPWSISTRHQGCVLHGEIGKTVGKTYCIIIYDYYILNIYIYYIST